MATMTHIERALAVAQAQGVARTRDFVTAGVPRVYLKRLVEDGRLTQVGRGLYRPNDTPLPTTSSLAEAARVVPNGVIALLSALRFHGLTTQAPHAVWLLIGTRAWTPVNPPMRLKIVRASGRSLTEGVETHDVDGVTVPITSPAKTVIDCFKYRRRVGLDVALEALQDFMKDSARRRQRDELWRYAEIDRVQTVIHPYLEALS